MRYRLHGVSIRFVTTIRERGILHPNGYSKGESIWHNPELDRKTPGRLSIDLNLDLGRAVGSALQGVGLEEAHISCTTQFPGPDQRQVGTIPPVATRRNDTNSTFRL